MIDFNDPIAVLSIIVPIIGGIIASVYYISKILLDRKDRNAKFSKFQRVKERGEWHIMVHSPSKPIRKCNATFKDQKLSLRGQNGSERSIALGEGCNFDMPIGISVEDNSFVIIRDDKKIIEKERFNKMETIVD